MAGERCPIAAIQLLGHAGSAGCSAVLAAFELVWHLGIYPYLSSIWLCKCCHRCGETTGRAAPAPCSGTSVAPRNQYSFRVVPFRQPQTADVRRCLRGSLRLAWGEGKCPHGAGAKELRSMVLAGGRERRQGKEEEEGSTYPQSTAIL